MCSEARSLFRSSILLVHHPKLILSRKLKMKANEQTHGLGIQTSKYFKNKNRHSDGFPVEKSHLLTTKMPKSATCILAPVVSACGTELYSGRALGDGMRTIDRGSTFFFRRPLT